MNDSNRRLLSGSVIPFVGVGAAVAVLALLAGSAPDPLASHWGLSGEPNDSIGRAVFVVLFGVLTAGCGVASAVLARRRDVTRGELGPPMAGLAFLQFLFLGIIVAVWLSNRNVSAWSDARNLGVPLVLLVPGVALVAAIVVGRLVRPIGTTRVRAAATAPSVGRKPSEALYWLSRAQSRWPLALGGLMAIAGVEVMLAFNPAIGVVVLGLGAAITLFARIRVTADQRGLVINYGPGSWPRTQIDLDRIEHAEAIDVTPMSHGGWGYRGSVRILGRAAVVIRAGEGIQLDLRGGKRFVVTVDDAETGSGAINDLVTI